MRGAYRSRPRMHFAIGARRRAIAAGGHWGVVRGDRGKFGDQLEISWRSVGDQLEISPADVVDVMHVVCVGRGRGSIM